MSEEKPNLWLYIGVPVVITFGFMFNQIKKITDHAIKHEHDICNAWMINDSTMTLLDNRKYDSTNKFLKFFDAKPRETPDTFHLVANSTDTVGLLDAGLSYAELIDDNKRAVVNIYNDRYEKHMSSDTINIVLK